MENTFRESFKKFRQTDQLKALSEALHPDKSMDGLFFPRQLNRISKDRLKQLALNENMDTWRAFDVKSADGCCLILDALTEANQNYWAKLCLCDWLKWPHKSNLIDCNIVDPFKSGTKLRWITYGYHHDWDKKVYLDQDATPMPSEMVQLAEAIAYAVGFADYKAEASIVNYYNLNSSMSGHVDRSERNMAPPLLSISLGQPCIFLLGGPTVQQEPLPILLNSGDICVMGGQSRHAYHGVPRIVKKKQFCDEHFDVKIAQYLNAHRINFNIRQVN